MVDQTSYDDALLNIYAHDQMSQTLNVRFSSEWREQGRAIPKMYVVSALQSALESSEAYKKSLQLS